jgi:hypothetical protein
MARRHLESLAIVLLTCLQGTSVAAQSALDRTVGLTEFGQPLIITQIDAQTIGTLSKAAAVPMGFEGLPTPPRQPLSIAATNRTVRDVLDAVVAADPRYESREHDGVIILRPVEAWNDERSLLNVPVECVSLQDVTANDLFGVLTRMVGVSTMPSQGPGDTVRFSVEIVKDSTLLSALTGIARAHGTLTWAVQPLTPRNDTFPLSISLFVGSTGVGFGISAASMSRLVPAPTCCAGQSLPSSQTTAPSSGDTRANPLVITGPSKAVENLPYLERIVGARPSGEPIVAYWIGGIVRELATAVRVPMGLESLPPSVSLERGHTGVKLTGMTLQTALDALVALDPRYQWRDLDGVIVFRPATTWADPSNRLHGLMGGLRLGDTTAAKAIGAFMALLGAPDHTRNSFPDTRTFSLDIPQGSVLDVLNGISRSHGELCWEWEELTPSDSAFSGGSRFRVHFGVFGGGGFGLAMR